MPEKLGQREEIQNKMTAPGFWDNQEVAQGVITKLKTLNAVLEPIADMDKQLDDAATLFELGQEENDSSVFEEAMSGLASLAENLERFELKALLNGPYDAGNCYLSIHAGSGGTESRDWAAMMARMYVRYGERAGWKMEEVDSVAGEEAGYSSITFHVVGPYAFGYMSCEVGVHRLVRISPFDSQGRRHTSFASVDAVPELPDEIDIEIDEEELRIDCFRAGGAGGQHVNKTSSAIRITHLTTNIVVQCQNERSQQQNKRVAMNMLKAKLLRLEEQKRDEKMAGLFGPKGDIAWGNQIRSYVLQPYTMIKDHRTEHETGRANDVLDGELDEFVEAYLRHRARQRRVNGIDTL